MNLLLFQKKRLSKGIRLALDFMGGKLDSRISFSRGSNATVVGSNGLIQYAPHNLLTYSEQFDNAVWVKGAAVTITANAITAPDGTTTADKFNYSALTNTPSQTITSTTTTYTIATYVKPSNTSFCRLRVAAVGGSATVFNSYFNITTGVVSSTGVATADFGSLLPSITSVGNGWYRISVTFTVLSALTSIAYGIIASQTSGGASAAGDELYAWGAQLNEGALQPYYSTTVKNLLGYSQNFGNAAWTKSNSSIAASTVIGPFGFDGGEKLVENTVNAAHGVNIDVTASPTTKYTVSSYIKAGERTWARIALIDNLGIDGGRAWFDLVNGVVGNVDVQGAGSNITASIVAVGNGWYRCSVSGQMNNSKTTLTSQIRLARSNGDISYIGDGVSGIYIFGAQLSDSASLDPYSYNPVAAPTSTAYYGPRFDYDPETLAPKGLLIEEQRTNLLLYSEDLSTVWNLGTGTVQSNTWTAPTGNLTGDIFTIGSDSTTPSQSTTITASATYTLSFFVSKPLTTAAFLRLRFGTAAGSISAFVDTSTMSFGVVQAGIVANYIKQIQNNIYQVSVRFTYGATDGGSRSLAISGVVANNSSVPDTGKNIAIWGIQYELGAFPTSYIPTTSATVTRAADNASMVGSNFSSWYNQSEGTVYCTSDSPLTTTTAQMNWYINDGNTNNTMFNRKNPSNLNATAVVSGGVTQGDITSFSAITAYSTVKSAFAYKLNDLAISVNGASVGTDLAATIPTVDRIHLGQNISNGQILNGHIQSIKYYPTRLPNGTLQGLTA
jgi:hypothetical protein